MSKNRYAFTLIELLVTIVLFSLLLVVALYSFRYVSLNIRNINNTNPQTAMTFNLLKDVFSSVYPYIDTDTSKRVGRERYYHYFEGKEKSCRFVSSSSLFYDELIVVHLFLEDEKLYYAEGNIFSKEIDYKNLDAIKLKQKIKVLDNVEMISFSYKLNDKSYKHISRVIPEGIRINFEKRSKKYSYIFSVKSKQNVRLERFIRDYDLAQNMEEI